MLFVFIRENFKEISKLYFYDSTNIHMSGVINHRIFFDLLRTLSDNAPNF